MTEGPEVRPTKIEVWGRRSGGFIHPAQGRMIKGKRAGGASSGNSSTPGARWNQGAFGQPDKKKSKDRGHQRRVRYVNGLPIDR